MYRYSPRPMSEYSIRGVRSDEVSVISAQPGELVQATWNLFWLSMPTIDAIPEKGSQWWKYYNPQAEALRTVIADVSEDEVLFRKLTMHPSKFIEWFEREDHSIYDCFDLWGTDWAKTVLSRAEVALRHVIAQRGEVQVEGNVFKVTFKRQA